jgi:hypothetical protein
VSSLAPETLRQDLRSWCRTGSAVKAEDEIGASCPINSMAPALAITEMVATGVEYDSSFDPVGEILKPLAAGPILAHFPEKGELGWRPER